MEQKFLKCNVCGNLVEQINATAVPIMCCGQPMMELKAGTTDGAAEKHVPVYEVNGNVVTVKVGSVEHPMTPEHYIQWIDIQTTGGIQRVNLTPSDKPEATFTINDGDSVVAVYEYCNLHGLWKA
ncbi:MAG: desulfoferrodoxin [Lachnospiraceae bacterium]|nr:desulfoferrodoxin [Lachnospiraceae bacterium]